MLRTKFDEKDLVNKSINQCAYLTASNLIIPESQKMCTKTT